MRFEPRTQLMIRGHHNPVRVVVGYTGIRIESGEDAINCMIYLGHKDATRMSEFILGEQALLEVESVRKRGRHEVRELR